MFASFRVWSVFGLACCSLAQVSAQGPVAPKRNVIVFVADGLRRGSVTAADMPTFLRVRTEGVDLRNSHAVFPTFTTANASAIATGHGLGDTGDYSNAIYPGVRLANPGAAAGAGTPTPFLEDDAVLADMNLLFGGNYLGEQTLLSAARAAGYAVASVGKLGPTAIQQIEAVGWKGASGKSPALSANGAIVVDDSTGGKSGLPLPREIVAGMRREGLAPVSPSRSNGYADASPYSNGFHGDAQTAGTLDSNHVQEQWMADVATQVLLPGFAAKAQPFVLLFWSRDPDGTQHNEGDSLQTLTPGINGETSKRGLRNADHCLKQLLDWLDAHPAIKANTDVLLTSDHGFATISRREVSAGVGTAEHSARQRYALSGKDAVEPEGTLPTGFLAIDLAYRLGLRLFDTAVAGKAPQPYGELTASASAAHYPSGGSALLGKTAMREDGSDAELIVAANGGSDLVYAPTGDAAAVHRALEALTKLDYVGGLFVDDKYCTSPLACPGALRLSDIGLVGTSTVPRPAIVVTYKVFYGTPGNIGSAAQISDTSLQEGQGMHGGFGREQTWNNMAAIGPDFKLGFIDDTASGNVDIAPTLAKILGVTMTSRGTLRGRVMTEALVSGGDAKPATKRQSISSKPANGAATVLEYEEVDGVRYYDRAEFVKATETGTGPAQP